MAPNVLSAGVIVVRKTSGGWRALLLRVYNYWDCPKGLVEPGEDPLATARREVREETTIDDLEFAIGREKDDLRRVWRPGRSQRAGRQLAIDAGTQITEPEVHGPVAIRAERQPLPVW